MNESDDFFVPNTRPGCIPVLAVSGRSLAEVWERSLMLTWFEGRSIRTEYDRKDKDGNFIDPPSKDCRMMMIVENPLAEPRFHKCFPGGPADLQEYRMEVLEGIKDHWIDLNDKKKWQYTYHERLTAFRIPGTYELVTEHGLTQQLGWSPIDQIQKMIEHLARSPYTRRCQAITWQPWEDMDSSDPPCLQRIWLRIMIDDDGAWWLNMDVEFRSRDAYKAAFMNADAFIFLMEYIAAEVGKIAGRKVYLGRYCDTSNSYHIYGQDHEQFEREFLKPLKTREFEDRDDLSNSRTARTEDWSELMIEAIPMIREKVRKKDADE